MSETIITSEQINETSLAIEVNDSFSLSDLLELQAKGFSVLRTPHIGNLNSANLATAAIGIPMRLVDQTVTAKDSIYNPAFAIQGANAKQIAPFENSLLTARATLSDDLEIDGSVLRKGSSLVNAHLTAIKSAFPFTETETMSQTQLGVAELVEELVAVVAKEQPELFVRLVDSEGLLVPGSEETALQLAQNGKVLALVDATEKAALIPNQLAILIDVILAALDSGQAVLFELAGTAMANYIQDKKLHYAQDLDKLYRIVRAKTSFGDQLPEQFKLVVVPSVNARFAVPFEKRGQLDLLVEAFFAMDIAMQTRRRFKANLIAATEGDTRIALIGLLTRQEKLLQGEEIENLRGAVTELPELFTDPKDRSAVSQFDMLGGNCYVQPLVLNMPLKEVGKMYRTLKKLYVDTENAR